jgi:hypothetical protein
VSGQGFISMSTETTEALGPSLSLFRARSVQMAASMVQVGEP